MQYSSPPIQSHGPVERSDFLFEGGGRGAVLRARAHTRGDAAGAASVMALTYRNLACRDAHLTIGMKSYVCLKEVIRAMLRMNKFVR